MSNDNKKKSDSPALKMQIGTRTIEEKPITYYADGCAPAPESKTVGTKKLVSSATKERTKQ